MDFEKVLKDTAEGLKQKEEPKIIPDGIVPDSKKEDIVAVDDITLDTEKIFSFLDTNEATFNQYLSRKTGKEIKSFEDLKEVKEVEVIKEVIREAELPEDVRRIYDYKKTTGRGLSDFLKANKDWKAESKESVVMEHIRQTEGLEGDMLKDFFTLTFTPEEGASEREEKLANIRFEKTYNQALKSFEEQQKQYALPSELMDTQRQAEVQSQEDVKRFQSGMTEAIRSTRSIEIDDFSFKLDEEPKLADKFSSLDGILGRYKVDGSFNYAALLKDLYAGQNRDLLAKSYAEHAANKATEAEMAKLSNKKEPSQMAQTEGSVDGARIAAEFRKHF